MLVLTLMSDLRVKKKKGQRCNEESCLEQCDFKSISVDCESSREKFSF